MEKNPEQNNPDPVKNLPEEQRKSLRHERKMGRAEGRQEGLEQLIKGKNKEPNATKDNENNKEVARRALTEAYDQEREEERKKQEEYEKGYGEEYGDQKGKELTPRERAQKRQRELHPEWFDEEGNPLVKPREKVELKAILEPDREEDRPGSPELGSESPEEPSTPSEGGGIEGSPPRKPPKRILLESGEPEEPEDKDELKNKYKAKHKDKNLKELRDRLREISVELNVEFISGSKPEDSRKGIELSIERDVVDELIKEKKPRFVKKILSGVGALAGYGAVKFMDLMYAFSVAPFILMEEIGKGRLGDFFYDFKKAYTRGWHEYLRKKEKE